MTITIRFERDSDPGALAIEIEGVLRQLGHKVTVVKENEEVIELAIDGGPVLPHIAAIGR